MRKNKIIPYNPNLRSLARKLRANGTVAEVLLWNVIKGKQSRYEFHRQVPLDKFIVDFYCHELSLAIEIDGASHEDSVAFANDLQRQKRLEDLGVTFLRYSDEDVKENIDGVVSKIREFIEGWETSP